MPNINSPLLQPNYPSCPPDEVHNALYCDHCEQRFHPEELQHIRVQEYICDDCYKLLSWVERCRYER